LRFPDWIAVAHGERRAGVAADHARSGRCATSSGAVAGVHFPDNPLVLEGLDSVYLSSEVAADLRASQVTALLSWMNAGGHLIVGIEQISDITASPWLRGVLPCEPKEIRTVPHHPEIQEWLRTGGPTNAPADSSEPRVAPRNRPMRPGVQRSGPAGTAPVTRSIRAGVSVENPFADSQPDGAFELADLPAATCTLRDGRTVVATGDMPLIVTANRGQGRVTALMFSPEREPFKSWRNLPTFGQNSRKCRDSLRLLRLFSRIRPEFGRNFRRDD
jgi:hypothetical protein